MEPRATYIGLGHWVTILDARQPVLGLVFGFYNPTVDEFQKCGLGVAVVLAQALEELVGLTKIEHVKGSPSLASADVKSPLAFREEC